MVDTPRSSFIPRETPGMTPDRVRRRHTFHVLGFIGSALLVGSILSAGLVFFLTSSAESDLEDAKRSLNEKKALFDSSRVAEMEEFDRRLKAAESLLKNHISPLHIFSALEDRTKEKVQFSTFALERTSATEILVSLEGTTEEFKTLALQEKGFGDDTILKNIVFKEVATKGDKAVAGDETENKRGIIFTLTGNVDSSSVLYDGRSTALLPQTRFVETDETLLAVDESELLEADGSVLGESITKNPL